MHGIVFMCCIAYAYIHIVDDVKLTASTRFFYIIIFFIFYFTLSLCLLPMSAPGGLHIYIHYYNGQHTCTHGVARYYYVVA